MTPARTNKSFLDGNKRQMFQNACPIVIGEYDQCAVIRTIPKQFYFTGHGQVFLSTKSQTWTLNSTNDKHVH